MAYKPLYQDVADRVEQEKKSAEAQAAAQGIYWKDGKAYKRVNTRLGPEEVRVASFDKNKSGQVGGSSGSGGSGSGSMYNQLIQQYQEAYESAKAANEARYNEARGLIGNLGTQQRQDINQQYGEQASVGMQDLISRGLGSSTVVPTMKMGIERERQAATNRLEDMLNRQTIDLIQSRNDVYPDMQMMLGLMQNYGQAQNVPNYGYKGIDPQAMMKMMQGMMPQMQQGGGYQNPYAQQQPQAPRQTPQMPMPPQNTTYPLTPQPPVGPGTFGEYMDNQILPPMDVPGVPMNLDLFKLPGQQR